MPKITKKEAADAGTVLHIIKAEKEAGLTTTDIFLEAQKAGITKKESRDALLLLSDRGEVHLFGANMEFIADKYCS